jgi:hypothetical protein
MVSTACGEWERRRIPELFDDRFYSALVLFNRFRVFGLPFAGGWAEQPAQVVDVLEALDGASRAVENERADKWRLQKKSGLK